MGTQAGLRVRLGGAHGHARPGLPEHCGKEVAGSGGAAQRVAARAVALLAQVAKRLAQPAPQARALPHATCSMTLRHGMQGSGKPHAICF